MIDDGKQGPTPEESAENSPFYKEAPATHRSFFSDWKVFLPSEEQLRSIVVSAKGDTADEMEAKAIFVARECFGKAYELSVRPDYQVHQWNDCRPESKRESAKFEASIVVEARPIAVVAGICVCDKHGDHAGCYEVCPCWESE